MKANLSINCFRPFWIAALCLLAIAGITFAQEFRGSITGLVIDISGAVVVGARVTVTNSATNVSTSAATDESGNYTVLYLTPGQYRVSVEAKGFKKFVRPGLEVRVGDKLTLDLQLEVGPVEETMNVTGQAPLLDTATASAGQVVDRRRISELPLSDGNPFTLTRLATGIGYIGDLKFSRPFDNAGTSNIVADGVSPRSGNEFTLDGSPNMAHRDSQGTPRVAFVPPADAVQEFKVETASFDAQQGHTAGATINVTVKSGTNSLHGTLYEFLRNDVLSGNDFFLNRAGKPRDALRYNRYGGTAGGPVLFPKLYDGRNKTFFFFAFEGLKDIFPTPQLFTVPTLAERRGDFSALPSGIVIFDPATAVKEGNRIRRSPIQCNGQPNVICPDRISPIAAAYLQFYPLPNQQGDAQRRNNFISPNPRSDTFHSETVRFDHTVSDRHKFFFRYHHNFRRETEVNWTGVVNGIRPTGNFLFRINNGGTYDHVYIVSPTTVFNLRVGFSRFNERNMRQHEGAFDPATLGFSPRTVALFGGVRYLPRFEFPGGTFSNLGDGLGNGTTFNIYSLQPTVTRIRGSHSLRLGYDLRAYRENATTRGHAAGRYDFGTEFTRGPLDNSASASIGQEFAAFLLGQPTGGLIDRNAARSNQMLYHGVFFQDDWKVTGRLNLNLGVRYEYEGATTERFDRNVRGFDTTNPSPIEAAARAAYAANPIPELALAGFRVRGGLLFADREHRGFREPDKNNVNPRVGLAYQIGKKGRTVLRGGWGMYSIPFIIDGVQQAGFSQPTNIVPTLDNGLTFAADLLNPFPSSGVEPPGRSAGLATFIGRSVEFVPLSRRNGRAMRWQIGLQRELGGGWLVEAAYVGNKGYDLTAITDILNAVPRQFLSAQNVRDNATINLLTANVPNPFQGLAPGTSLNGSTAPRQQLLRPFPQFVPSAGQPSGIRTRRQDGSSLYHSGQFRLEKRFTQGYTLLVSYTRSKALEQLSFLNESDTSYEQRVPDFDIPHRLVVSGVWELPLGRGRAWGNGRNKVIGGFVGGWQLQGIYQAQSGRPLTLGNLAFFGDLSKLRTHISGSAVDAAFDTSGFYFFDSAVQTGGVVDGQKQRNDPRIRLASNIRTLPSRLPHFRGQGLNLWDVSVIKNFSLKERVNLQLRGEFLNAFNHPQFENPNTDPTSSSFGKITQQNNLPRNVQLGIKLSF